jgi:hypothetical protein
MSKNDIRQSHSAWRDIAVAQLSNANNTILGFSTGFIVFCLDKCDTIRFNLNIYSEFEKSKLFFGLCLLSLLFSIFYGISVLVSRLYDFRITRHVTLTRLRSVESLEYSEFEKTNMCDRIGALFQVFCKDFKFIPKDVAKDLKAKDGKFESLRKLSFVLGEATWLWIKFQVFYFLLGCLFFVLYLFLK